MELVAEDLLGDPEWQSMIVPLLAAQARRKGYTGSGVCALSVLSGPAILADVLDGYVVVRAEFPDQPEVDAATK